MGLFSKKMSVDDILKAIADLEEDDKAKVLAALDSDKDGEAEVEEETEEPTEEPVQEEQEEPQVEEAPQEAPVEDVEEVQEDEVVEEDAPAEEPTEEVVPSEDAPEDAPSEEEEEDRYSALASRLDAIESQQAAMMEKFEQVVGKVEADKQEEFGATPTPMLDDKGDDSGDDAVMRNYYGRSYHN